MVHICRTTQSLLSAANHVADKQLRLETLSAVSFAIYRQSNLMEMRHSYIFNFSIVLLPSFITWCPQLTTLNCPKICSLAENTSSKAVFNEVLAAAGRDIVTKDISRLRGGWPMQDAFYVSYILLLHKSSLCPCWTHLLWFPFIIIVFGLWVTGGRTFSDSEIVGCLHHMVYMPFLSYQVSPWRVSLRAKLHSNVKYSC